MATSALPQRLRALVDQHRIRRVVALAAESSLHLAALERHGLQTRIASPATLAAALTSRTLLLACSCAALEAAEARAAVREVVRDARVSRGVGVILTSPALAVECGLRLDALPPHVDVTDGEADAGDVIRALVGHPHALDDRYLGFGPHSLHVEQVFHATPHTLAFVNIKPVVPGHVLVAPRRRVARVERLSDAELTDLWRTARRVGRALEAHHGASSLTFAIQDGAAAGQTVPHVHIHVLPRHRADLPVDQKDAIYDMIDASEQEQVFQATVASPAAAAAPTTAAAVASSSVGVGTGAGTGGATAHTTVLTLAPSKGLAVDPVASMSPGTAAAALAAGTPSPSAAGTAADAAAGGGGVSGSGSGGGDGPRAEFPTGKLPRSLDDMAAEAAALRVAMEAFAAGSGAASDSE